MQPKRLFQILPILLLTMVPVVGTAGCDRIPSIVQQSTDDKLIQQLRDDAQLNLYDEQLIQQFRNMGQAIIPKLLPLLQDRNANVRSHAAYILGEMGKPAYVTVPNLIPLLKDSNEQVQWTTATALGKMGSAAQPAVDVLIKALQDPSEEVRWSATYALEQMGTTAKSAIPALIAAFKRSDGQFSAASALSQMGQPAIVALTQALKDPDLDIRSGALLALGRMGRAAKSTAPQILPHLKESNAKIRVQAAWALQAMGEEPTPLLSVLMAALKDPQKDVRLLAIETLGRMGKTAKPAIPLLITVLKDPNPRLESLVRTKAAEALGQLGETQILIAALQDQKPRVRWRAAYVLGRMGTAAKPAIPALTIALQDSDELVQRETKSALERLNRQN